MMNIISKFKEIKNLSARRENVIFFILISIIFSLDRISKIKILENFSDRKYFVNNYINFDLIWNTGVGFGLLSANSYLIYNLITLIVGIVIMVLFYVSYISKYTDKLILSVIIGAALGNFYDRLSYNAVPDFIDLHFNNFHWFTFNVADIFITIGIIAFIMKDFFLKTN